MSVNRHESELAENHAARLTAYALGQLEGQEQAEVESELAASAAARQAVEAVRALAGHLREASRHEPAAPSASLRAAVVQRLDQLEAVEVVARLRPWAFRHGLRLLLALAACLLIAAIPVAWLAWLDRRPGAEGLALVHPMPAGKLAAPAAREPAGFAAPEALAEAAPQVAAQPLAEAPPQAAPAKSPAPLARAEEMSFAPNDTAKRSRTIADRTDRAHRASPTSAPPVASPREKAAPLAPSPAAPSAPGTMKAVVERAVTKESKTVAKTAEAEAGDSAAPAPPGMSGMAGGRLAAKAEVHTEKLEASAARRDISAPPPASVPRPGRAVAAEKGPPVASDVRVVEDKPTAGLQKMPGTPWRGEARKAAGVGPLSTPAAAAPEGLAPKAEAKAEAEAVPGNMQPAPAVPQAPATLGEMAKPAGPPKPWEAVLGMDQGQPALGSLPGYRQLPPIAGRAGQAALPSRVTAGIGPRVAAYPGLTPEAPIDAPRRVPLGAQTARRAARQDQPTASDSGPDRQETSSRKAHLPLAEHPFIEVGPYPVSSFPLEVDRTQWAVVSEAVQAGRRPSAENLDINGLINAFPYRDPVPPAHAPLTVGLEVADCPWKAGHRLVRIAVVAADARVLAKQGSGSAVPQQIGAKAPAAAAPAGLALARPAPAAVPTAPAPAPVVARDVRILVEFNPLQAAAYRLIGMDLVPQDRIAPAEGAFSAPDLKAGERVLALYQVIPPALAHQAQFPQLRYQQTPAVAANLTKEAYSGQLLTVHLQYREAATGKVQRAEFSLKDSVKPFGEASADLRFAAAVAACGMILRNSPYAGSATLEWVEKTAAQAARDGPAEPRTQFVELVRQLRRMPAQ